MAEILVKAISATHPNADKDRAGCYKLGDMVVVMEDGHPWGLEERLPKFYVIKIPTIPAAIIRQFGYTSSWMLNETDVLQRRRWRILIANLTNPLKNKLNNLGALIVKANSYNGTSDVNWTTMRNVVRNTETGLNETRNL